MALAEELPTEGDITGTTTKHSLTGHAGSAKPCLLVLLPSEIESREITNYQIVKSEIPVGISTLHRA
ncbi:hypothetical protein SK128_022362 [Halocaridina rubra]|uniref:Uncharacterized protein n=1 Tax=Halocaridina rubra TaxID=373956 RepID=A0AAN9ABA5_HALRR